MSLWFLWSLRSSSPGDVPPADGSNTEWQLSGTHLCVQQERKWRRAGASHFLHSSQSQSHHHLHSVRSVSCVQPGRAVGRQQRRQAQVSRPDPHNEPHGRGPAGDFHRDAGGRGVEHHGAVAGGRRRLQAVDVHEAGGDVLLRLCDSGHQFGQAVRHPQPAGNQRG